MIYQVHWLSFYYFIILLHCSLYLLELYSPSLIILLWRSFLSPIVSFSVHTIYIFLPLKGMVSVRSSCRVQKIAFEFLFSLYGRLQPVDSAFSHRHYIFWKPKPWKIRIRFCEVALKPVHVYFNSKIFACVCCWSLIVKNGHINVDDIHDQKILHVCFADLWL